MSQSQVGQVYAKVIEEVCELSQTDFEEGGVDPGTLEKLQSNWQKKLSELKIAQLPWDPPPTPAPAQHASASSGPGNAAKSQAQPHLNGNGNAMPAPPTASAASGVRIKTEPGSYPPQASQTNGYTMPPIPQLASGSATIRAALELQQRFGQRAAPQINQLQQQSGQQRGQGLPPNYPNTEDRKPQVSNFSQPMQQASKVPANSSQTDGAGDSLVEWKTEIARRREAATQSPGEGDRLLHRHYLEIQQRLEGGGLMLPLDERYLPSQRMKRKLQTLSSTDGSSTADNPDWSTSVPTLTSLRRAQGDAAGDDDEESPEADEDAINSDLDDPDQPDGDEDNEENTDQVMLCTYDKVQRVKNKWKCTLKDGVLKVGGNEYVFHKGQGEFEW